MFNPSANRCAKAFLPFAIFIFAFLTRFCYISLGPYHLDCLTLAIKSTETLQTHQLQYLFGSGYPLVVILGSLFVFIFQIFGGNDPVIAVNFMSVVFGALGAWMFFLLIRKIDSEMTALVGALLFCVSPILWGTSVFGMSHSPSLFFLLTSLYFLFSFLETSERKMLFIAAIAMGLMGSSRLHDMIVMIVPVSYLVLSNDDGRCSIKTCRERFGVWVQFLLIASVVVVLFHMPYFMNHVQENYKHQWSDYWYLGLSSNFRGLWSEYLTLSLSFLKDNYTLMGLIFVLGGFVIMMREKRRLAVFLSLWFLVFFFFFGNLSTVVPRFFVVMIPSLIVFQAYALVFMFDRGQQMRWWAMGILIVLMVMQASVILPGIMYRHEQSAIKEFSTWVGQVTEGHARVIAGDENPFISYYGRRSSMTRPSCAVTCSQEELEVFRGQVDGWLKSATPVYMTNTALLADNPNGEFKNFMEKYYQLDYVGEHFMEDWHQDGFHFRVGYEKLFRIVVKEK